MPAVIAFAYVAVAEHSVDEDRCMRAPVGRFASGLGRLSASPASASLHDSGKNNGLVLALSCLRPALAAL